MITCTLRDKKYSIDFVSGRALRELEPAAQMYGRIVAISNAALKGEVPEDATVVGVPGRIVRLCGDKLDHIHTPDPVMLEIEALKRRMALLEEQINDTKKET